MKGEEVLHGKNKPDREEDQQEQKESADGVKTAVSSLADAAKVPTSPVEAPERIWILLSTLYEGGGAEVQAQMELRRRRRKGETAYLLTFDPKLQKGESREENHVNLMEPWTNRQKRLLENVDSPRLICDTEQEIIKILQNQGVLRRENGGKSRERSMEGDCSQENPDREKQEAPKTAAPVLILHIHNITFGYTSICKALGRVKKQVSIPCVTFETIHDCRIICDKGTRLLPDGSFCNENSFAHCYENCMKRP
ncbi:MAG: hypothetical protein LKE85_00410 [Lachnospiraceae bacterium]|nr:hypothetical protein [Lachnospiraceae bacterium]